jgi:glyoxylase-like metal-dependent hydrolase (beta-lactamase superfamily II)
MNENNGIFTYNVGSIEVFIIVEGQGTGKTDLLVGADKEIIDQFIPNGTFSNSANCFLIKTGKNNVLIDTGTGYNGIIIDKIKKIGLEPEQIDVIFITHLHRDHIGSLQKDGKINFPNANVYLSTKEFEYFTKTDINQSIVDTLSVYGKKVITFEPNELGNDLKEIINGIIPITAYGHTPGHTVYLIKEDKAEFLIIGDLLHVPLIQFPIPEISVTYDNDHRKAAIERRKYLDYSAKNKIPIGGMHIVYPGIGNVFANNNGFDYIPMENN